MRYPDMKRPLSSKLLIGFEVFYSIMGLISGLLLIMDPSGELLGFTADIREDIPFQSFLPVGLFLFFVYGVGSLVLAYGAFTRKEMFLGKVSGMFGRHWSWTGGMALMATLVVWLVVEGMLIGLDWAATYFTSFIGAVIFVLLVMPATRRYYK